MTYVQDRILRGRILESGQSVLLLGARQVGKSTLCRSLNSDLYVDLADEREFLDYSKSPDRLRHEIDALKPKKPTVIVDEIQRVPSLLNTIQSIIDQRKIKFVLTGSSARKLKRGGANLLPGRVIVEHMDPLTYCESELSEARLERALQVGMLPGIFLDGRDAIDVLESYADIYLREEIQAEALTRNLGAYARFLDTVAGASGKWVNYSKISSDAEIPKETVRRFVQLLEDTLVAFRLPPFQPGRSTSRRIVQRERILLFDVGVRNALLHLHRRPPRSDQIGATFEQWVMLQVIYINRAMRKGWKISTYRTEAGAEVDLVVDRGDDIVAIEIKAGRNATKQDSRGLQSLASLCDRPVHKWILYRGARSQRLADQTFVHPVLDGLAALSN